MKSIYKLLEEYCPTGVKYWPIKEIAEVGTGSSDRKDATEDGVYPFYVRSKDILRSDKYLYDETAILIPGEGGVGDIFHFAEGKYDLHQRAYRIHFTDNRVEPKFAYYYFCNSFKRFITKKSVEATVTSIRKPMIEGFEVPVPPLEVQREIIRVLDSFTLLTTELTAELTARKRQYEYYKEKLFESNEIEYKPLSEVADIIDSLHATPQYVEEGFSMIRVADIKGGYVNTEGTLKVDEKTYIEFIKRYKPQHDDIIVSRVGSFGNFSLVPDEDVCLGQNVALIHPKINNKYLYYYLNSQNVTDFLSRNARGGGYKNIGIKDILQIPIAIQSLERQEHIVSVLEKFDYLSNSISNGIPAEIEARQKQYEFYRDKLLVFKELDESI